MIVVNLAFIDCSLPIHQDTNHYSFIHLFIQFPKIQNGAGVYESLQEGI